MVKRTTSLMLLFFCLLIVVLGCAHSQESMIIGKWACKATGDEMELLKDHTCALNSMGFRYPGRWMLSKSDFKVEAEQIIMKGSFDGKHITVEDAIMHNKYVFEKVAETKK